MSDNAALLQALARDPRAPLPPDWPPAARELVLSLALSLHTDLRLHEANEAELLRRCADAERRALAAEAEAARLRAALEDQTRPKGSLVPGGGPPPE